MSVTSSNARDGGARSGSRNDAAKMLMRGSLVAQLDAHEAELVIGVMRPQFVKAGTVIMREGEAEDVDYMALLLEGQVRAESSANMPGDEVVISIIGPGQMIGEMGLLDGAPRSATCTALTDLKLGILSRTALRGLVEVQPAVATRLMLLISQSLSDRLRESNRRYRMLSRVTRALQRELDATHSVNRRLMDGESA